MWRVNKKKLDWKSLDDTLKTKSIAINSSQIFTEARSGSLNASSSSASINKISYNRSFSENCKYSISSIYNTTKNYSSEALHTLRLVHTHLDGRKRLDIMYMRCQSHRYSALSGPVRPPVRKPVRKFSLFLTGSLNR